MTDDYAELIARLREADKMARTFSNHEIESTIQAESADALTHLSQQVQELDLQREQAVAELQALIEDCDSMRDSLTKESTARCEAEDKVAALESQLSARESAEPVGYVSESALRCLKHNAVAAISPRGMRDQDETIPVYLAHPPAAAASEDVLDPEEPETHTQKGSMLRISKFIEQLQGIRDKFGNTCVYIRHNSCAWGATALHWQHQDDAEIASQKERKE